MEESLRVAVIQTTIDSSTAWGTELNMSLEAEDRAIREIQQHIAALLHDDQKKPDIVLLPEVTVPLGFLWRLRKMATEMNAIVIAGMDYQRLPNGSNRVVNRAAIIVPNGWGRLKKSTHSTLRFVGKTYPAKAETSALKKLGCKFRQYPQVWVFDAHQYGKFAVALCYDFLDLERVAMYRLKIQHLFVIAYNRDISSFDHAAEALSRMVYCNVVICNTGHFGGSAALSPYYEPHRRLIYRHCGKLLSTSQIIKLPVRELVWAQQGKATPNLFKGLPPGALPLPESLVMKNKTL